MGTGETSTHGFARRQVFFVLTAALLFSIGWLAAASFNGVAIVWFLGAGLCLVLAARHHKLVITLLLIAGACGVGAWGTLNGGAAEWTAIPWIIGVVAALVLAVARLIQVRRRRPAPGGS